MIRRLALDMDDVVCDLMNRWLPEISILAGEGLLKKDMTSWDMEKNTGLYKKLIYGILAKPGFFKTLSPYPGMLDALQQLQASSLWNKNEVVLVSAAIHGHKDKTDWIERYLEGNGIQVDGIIYTKQKHMVDADILVDDNSLNCEQFVTKGRYGNRAAILFDQPWNQSFVIANGQKIKRMVSWDQLNELIESYVYYAWV